MGNLPDSWPQWKRRVDSVLQSLLPAGPGPGKLLEAQRYAVLAGGKRIRSTLAMATFVACGGRDGEVDLAASALELFHTYSLIHDDLPSMDDDSLRRGKPATHIVFGEATAILAGDSLQTLGFSVLAREPAGERYCANRNEIIQILAHALGCEGMAGGQALDLDDTPSPPSLDHLRHIHSLKTGVLFKASVASGAIWAGATPSMREALDRYSTSLGLLFQITDDLLDATSDEHTLGKTPGKDSRDRKWTYFTLLGLEKANDLAKKEAKTARSALADFPGDSDALLALVDQVECRKS